MAFVVIIFLVSGIAQAGITQPRPSDIPAVGPTLANVVPTTTTPSWIVDPPLPGHYLVCQVLPAAVLHAFGGAGCSNLGEAKWEAWAAASELATMKNLLIMMGNSVNQTASAIANLNATSQELLSYFENRAEALVPYFLNVSWNESTRAQLAIDSGLVPAIEGLSMAYSYQMFQDWNATVTSWNNLFGVVGTYAHSGFPAGTGINKNYTIMTHHLGPGSGVPLMVDGVNYSVSVPWQAWNGTHHPFFFNLMPGGTIICAPVSAGFTVASCPTYQIDDFTQGTNFPVPAVSFDNFAQNHLVPSVSTLNHVGQFDLLKLVCKANCGSVLSDVETLGGYAFLNVSAANPDRLSAPPYYGISPQGFENSMVYRMFVAAQYGSSSFSEGWVPSLEFTYCGMVNDNFVGHRCDTGSINPAGNTTALGTGPAAVAAANDSALQYAPTFQHLLNNTVNDSEIYYLTLRAITNNSKVSIPADCVIPGPSAGLPASVNPGGYRLSVYDGLAAYWSYLNGVGKAFANRTIYGLEFCGKPNLALGFNWSASWLLRLKITASIYITNLQGLPVYPNGTRDPTAVYANPLTWPVKNITPTLLYSYEFVADLTVGAVTPIPANNPFAAILVNYSGNPLYHYNLSGNLWGIPTYLQLYGEGNFVYPNGTTSSVSGGTPSKGSAIFISSCLLNNVAQASCNISVTYFNAFVFGHEHGLVGPPPPPGGGGSGGGGSGVNGGICSSLFGWIPFIGSAIVSFCNFILGILEIVLIVLILAAGIYIVYRSTSGRRGGRSGGGSRTVNVYT